MAKSKVAPRTITALTFLLLLNCLPAGAQTGQGESAQRPTLSDFIQLKHGFDSELINGIQYHYPYTQTRSHPYYLVETSLSGSLLLSGIRYEDIRLLYDIYAQHLVLEFDREPLGFTKILLSPLHTDAFQIAGNSFVKTTLDENGPLYYQLIRVSGLSCYIHWKKNKLKTGNDTRYLYYFTKPVRTYFLEIHGTLFPFSSRRDLASLFQREEEKRILKYMRLNKLTMKDASVIELSRLMEFIASETSVTQQN